MPELETRILWQCKDVTVQADKALLVTLIRNLVLNAAAADSSGNRIRVWSRKELHEICLGVTDSGPGIPQQELMHIKEPFYRMDKSRAREGGGNGLGLTICEQIARAHKTNLKIESRLGQGTTVSITLQEVKA